MAFASFIFSKNFSFFKFSSLMIHNIYFRFSIHCRRMFPTVRVSFSGLMRPSKPSDFYAVLLDIVPVDSRRYRYAYHRSAWLVAGKADPPPPPRLHAHPDTPFTFEALTKQVISFEKAKLTNNELDRNGQVSFDDDLFR